MTAMLLAVMILGPVLGGCRLPLPSQATPKKTPSKQHVPAARHRVVLGISVSGFINETPSTQATELSKIKAIGITSIRLDANWKFIQPAGPGAYNWTGLDQEITSVRAAHMSVDLVIDGCPPWAAAPSHRPESAPQPASASQYGNFVAQVARRYLQDGVTTFEIWNEPNDSKYWQPAPNPAFYAKMLIASYRTIKQIDKSAFVILGGLAPVANAGGNYTGPHFLSLLYDNGIAGYFDAVGDHPYSFPTLPGAYEPWSAWSQMSDTFPSLRSVMDRHGDGSKPIWITEFGAPSNGPSGVGAHGQAAILRLGIAAAKKTGWIGAFYIYTWRDAGDKTWTNADWFGLLTNLGRPKAAYEAVAAAIKKTHHQGGGRRVHLAGSQ